MRQCLSCCLLAWSFLLGAVAAYGQAGAADSRSKTGEPIQKLRDATRSTPLMWDVQTVIDGYIENMVRIYDLSEKQEAYTRELLTQRVKQFLRDYEKDARVLFGEYFEYQSRGEMPSAEAAKEFARRAKPLADAIRQEIMEGNMQWRRILNEQQLKQHDKDLDLMKRQFDAYDKMMTRWSDGQILPSDVGIRQRQIARSVPFEDAMEHYVRSFIARYELDKGQQETARSILREAQEEVSRYREAHKTEFEQIAAQLKELTASDPKNDIEATKRLQAEGRKLTARQAELEKPLHDTVFNRLKTRLEDVPTSDQKARYKARQDALMERIRKSTTSQPARGSTQPATAATSSPASEPAK